jgi:lipopolysaccharide transport system permease protein
MSDLSDDRPVRVIRPKQSLFALLFGGIASLRMYKHLLLELALLRLRVRYKQSLLGWTWAVVHPLALVVTYTLVFSKLIGLKGGTLPYALFVLAGLVPWIFFSNSVSSATAGMVAHRHLISRAAFPREIIPLSYVAAALVDLGVSAIMLVGAMAYYGLRPNLYGLYAIPVVVMLAMCAAASALCCSAFQARFRDVGIAMPLLLQVLIFTTPVVYSSAVVPTSLRTGYMLNPLAVLVEAFRQSAVLGVRPDLHEMIYCGAISAGLLLFAYVLFRRLDATLADVI